MDAGRVTTGRRVQIAAKDDFYAFIDGWTGQIGFPGWKLGYVIVHCQSEGITKEFLVPPDELRELN